MDFRITNDGKIFIVRWKDINNVIIGSNFDTYDIGTCKIHARAQDAMEIP